ncbi:MAG: C-terminal binding protein [Chloroflexi bacterium]|nr:C-terminal binding protein [Chloroflexota bacterium]
MAEPKLVMKVERRSAASDEGFVKRQIERAGFRYGEAVCKTPEELVAACKDADAILASGPEFPKTVIDQLDKCRVIVQCSVGVNNVDVEACTDAGIMVANLAQFCVLEVRNHTIALLLAVNRKLMIADRMVHAGRWDTQTLYPVQTLYGQTLGLLAFGTIPRLITPVAQCLGMNVIVHDPFVDVAVAAEYKVAFVGLEELLKFSDYVSNHIPLGPRTHHFLKEEHFRMMKPTAYFINTSRGAVVDEMALYRALKEGWIAGAGLDVLEKEPPDKDNPILSLENVVLSPHSAGGTTGTMSGARRWNHATEECIRVLNGEWPRWFINPHVKSKARK